MRAYIFIAVTALTLFLASCATKLERARKVGQKTRQTHGSRDASNSNKNRVCRERKLINCVKKYFKRENGSLKAWSCSKKIKDCIQQPEIDSVGPVENKKQALYLQLEVATKIVAALSAEIRAQEKIIAQREKVDPAVKTGLAMKACVFAGINDYWKKKFLKEGLPREKVRELHKMADWNLSRHCNLLADRL
ncbi:MAG: hypothetical protein ABEJ02_01075 [Candidatus Paceibacteria bacterium]